MYGELSTCWTRNIITTIFVIILTVLPIILMLSTESKNEELIITTGTVENLSYDEWDCGTGWTNAQCANGYVTFSYTCLDGTTCNTQITIYESVNSYSGYVYTLTSVQNNLENDYPVGSNVDLYLTEDGTVRLTEYSILGYIIWLAFSACFLSCIIFYFLFELREYLDLRMNPGKRGTLASANGGNQEMANNISLSVTPQAQSFSNQGGIKKKKKSIYVHIKPRVRIVIVRVLLI